MSRHTLRHGTIAIAAVAAIAAGALGFQAAAAVIGDDTGPSAVASAPVHAGPSSDNDPFGAVPGNGSSDSSSAPGAITDPWGATGQGGSRTTQATPDQLRGVVDIITTVNYDQGEAAGTGMIMSADGLVLTNNHVIEGSTSIKVTDLSTGTSYTATVVGTSPTNDIAVLRLHNASGLSVANFGSSASVAVGDAVVGVGNAGNDAGTAASSGVVTAVNQNITASDGTGSSAENLTGLIETSAGIEAGDSGGPLYAADGTIVGIDTAAHTNARTGTTLAGYAIPIDRARTIARQITSGVDNETIHQGLPAFLGITIASSSAAGNGTGGVTIGGAIDGTAAARAGLTAGDTITGANGRTIESAEALTDTISSFRPGDRMSLTWIDAAGTSHTATITLGEGPAD
ncbi:MAG: S1C family serine protease [Nostocoides sp.]